MTMMMMIRIMMFPYNDKTEATPSIDGKKSNQCNWDAGNTHNAQYGVLRVEQWSQSVFLIKATKLQRLRVFQVIYT